MKHSTTNFGFVFDENLVKEITSTVTLLLRYRFSVKSHLINCDAVVFKKRRLREGILTVEIK